MAKAEEKDKLYNGKDWKYETDSSTEGKEYISFWIYYDHVFNAGQPNEFIITYKYGATIKGKKLADDTAKDDKVLEKEFDKLINDIEKLTVDEIPT